MIREVILIMAFLFGNTQTTTDPQPTLQTLELQEEDPMRPIPKQAMEIITRYEGLRTKAYQDSNGIWTIGYGNTQGVKEGDTITDEEAEEQLRIYLQNLGPQIIKNVKIPLNNNQYAALLSFAYNVGIGNLENSTLLKLINDKDTSAIVQQFLRWDKDQAGQELAGLKARRMAEASLYLTPLSMVS